jgi:glycosyltransferase involved in cell wall biosynthesis
MSGSNRIPKVTVLMSVYNGQRYLREAIESILSQTWKDFEFLIINDASTDRSRDIITSYDDARILLVDNPENIGLTKSLNRGLEMAKGEYIARQDDDDISLPRRLEHQVRFLDEHLNMALVGTNIRFINGRGKSIISFKKRPLSNMAVKWHLIFSNPFIHTSVMIRRSIVWGELQGYDERFVRAQDFELFSRIARKYSVRNMPQCLVRYRRHSGSLVIADPALNDSLAKDIILDNIKRFLNLPDPPDDLFDMAYTLRRGPEQGESYDPARFVKQLGYMYKRFCELHPSAAGDLEIHRHMADQLGKIAYYTALFNKLRSVGFYIRACLTDPGTFLRIPLPLYLSLLLSKRFRRRI